jgi:hypothetical protein
MKIRDRIPGLRTSTATSQTRRRPKKKPAPRPIRASNPRKNLKQRAKRKPRSESGPTKWFAFLRGLFK